MASDMEAGYESVYEASITLQKSHTDVQDVEFMLSESNQLGFGNAENAITPMPVEHGHLSPTQEDEQSVLSDRLKKEDSRIK